MSLDANEPSDARLVQELATYIRANRVVINGLTAGTTKVHTNLTISAGTTTLSVGTSGNLSSAAFETIKITGSGAATIATITGGTEGDVKVFVFQDSNINFTDSADKASGKFYLNHLPAGSNFEAEQDDALWLMNVGGDGGTTQGYWVELDRKVSVK